MKDHMMGKCKPFNPEDWPQVVLEAFEILSKASWVPVATLIIGLPRETEEDIDLTIDLVRELRAFKSLIVPLFLVSEGALKDRAESFSLEKMTPKRSELFLKCWEHNLDWGKTFLKEYSLTKGKWKRYGVKLVFNYAIRQGRELIRKCQNDYEYDLPAMIRDAREGEIDIAPLPIRLIYKLIRPRAQISLTKKGRASD
jgi:radical SAM superfamily enzyme YgiQ (UPF0313 family)